MTDDELFMGEALAEARLAAGEGEVPVGAVAVCNGRKGTCLVNNT